VLVALVILTALGASIFWISVRSPTYRSTATLLVTPLTQDESVSLPLALLRDSGDPTRTMQTAAALVDTRAAASETARKLGNGWTTESVQKAVVVTPEGQTNILDVIGTADSGTRSAHLANAYASSIIEERRAIVQRMSARAARDIETRVQGAEPGTPGAEALQSRLSELQALASGDDPTLSAAESAQPAEAPLGAKSWQVIVLALIAGSVLASGAALLLTLLPLDVISSEDELVDLWPLPVVARVPQLPRRSRTADARDPRAMEPFRSVRRQLELGNGRNNVVLIASPSHGDGKTTSALMFARVLAERGDVVLADADHHKSDLRRLLGLAPHNDHYELDGFSSTPIPVPGLDSIELIDLGDGTAELGTPQVVRAVKAAAERADWVVIDTPPLGEVSDALPLLGRADAIIVVVRLGNTKRTALRMTRELMSRSGATPIGLMVLGVPQVPRAYGYGT
jgi:Mrp family chromosome partitioning ATPase